MRLRALLLVVLLAPLASAGTAAKPEITDGRGEAAPPRDILAAWFEGEDDGLRFHIRVAEARSPAHYADTLYWFLFRIEGASQEVAASVGFGDDDRARGHLMTGTNSGGLDDRGSPFTRGIPLERAANGRVTALRIEPGAPATFSGRIPWGAVPGLEPGVTLVELSVGATPYDRTAREWTGADDSAVARGPYVATIESRVFPIIVPAWMIPTIIGASVALGGSAGLGLAALTANRQRARRTPTPAAPAAATTPRPPGQRFQRAPPHAKR